jgi:hypothetical protein
VASVTGWGRETWGNGAWGSNGVLEVTGVEAAGATGSETVVIVQTITVTGVEATGSTGTIIFQGDLITGWGRSTWGSSVWGDPAVVIETGVEAASAIGTPTFIHGAGVEPTGVQAAGIIGNVGFGVKFYVTGVEAIGSVNTPMVWSDIDTSSGTIWIDIAA